MKINKIINKLLLYNNTEVFILANSIKLYLNEYKKQLTAIDGYNLYYLQENLQETVALFKMYISNNQNIKSISVNDKTFMLNMNKYCEENSKALEYCIDLYLKQIDIFKSNENFINEISKDIIGIPHYLLSQEESDNILELNINL
jgi:hypothetical protein